MSQSPKFKTILERTGNFIAHHKFIAFLTLLSTLIALWQIPQIQNLFTKEIIDKPLLCPEPESTYSIKIKYPKGWHLDCTEDALSGEVAKLIAPKTDKVKLFIVVNELKQLMSLDKYIKSLVKIIEKNSSDVKFVNNQAILGNRSAYELRYTIKKGQIKLIRKEVVMLDARRAYHVIYEAPTYQYNRFKNDAEEMIQSFEINVQTKQGN
jgi:hypothetical protein